MFVLGNCIRKDPGNKREGEDSKKTAGEEEEEEERTKKQ